MLDETLVVIAGLFLLAHAVTVGLCLRRIRVAAEPAPVSVIGQPRLTLLRPVCGLDPYDPETLESSFLQDYPDYEIIFCAPSEDDPAVALLRGLAARYPHVPARILTGQVPRTGNPKLDNLWKGWAAADAEWVCMADANLLLPRDYLARVVGSWREGTGLVSSPAWGSVPEGFAARLEAAFMNSNQARLLLAGDSLDMGFTQGKTMFWNRAMLNTAGGLAVLGERLAEDVTATQVVRRLGLKVRLTPMPFAQPLGRRDLQQVWNRQLRWSRVRRDGFAGLFLLEPANGAVLPLLLLLLAGAGLPLILTALAIWYAAEWLLMRRAGWRAGWRDLAVLPLRDLALPVLWAATFLRKGITWRGKAMEPPATTTAIVEEART
ncbi:ceramide glucosyltransferase [Gemmobacter serpentinus]|uniref:ceramide glucosyltransferase n=1 Tax=Gemmobacter serpentinus TaxID=2652247 RepID=UPI00124E2E59|nr:ceramide glucosyltransferase [Gemmobacter serpentinus]